MYVCLLVTHLMRSTGGVYVCLFVGNTSNEVHKRFKRHFFALQEQHHQHDEQCSLQEPDRLVMSIPHHLITSSDRLYTSEM